MTLPQPEDDAVPAAEVEEGRRIAAAIDLEAEAGELYD